MFSHGSNRGFTLIEVMVVIVIAALMVSILVFGFDQILSRRKGAAAEEVYQWLQAAADTAVFQSTVIGVARKDDRLILLAFYRDDWYKLADQEALTIDKEIRLSWSESLLKNNGLRSGQTGRDGGRSTPQVVIMPSGEITPEGEINIFGQGLREGGQGAEQPALARVHWDEGEGFELSWNRSQ